MKPVNRNEAPAQAQVAQPPIQEGPAIAKKARRAKRGPMDPRKRLTVTCGALAAVTVASLGLGIWQMSEAQQMRASYEADMRTVVVAAADVEAGTAVTAEDVALAEVPGRYVPKDAAAAVEEVVGLKANANISEGNAVSLSTLQASKAPATLANAPEEGKLAYMVPLSTASGLSPLLHVGDLVQVIVGANGVDGQVVAEDVRVLALDGALTGSSDGYETVTLELDASQAEQLYDYVEIGGGSIHLALQPTEPAAEQAPVADNQ